jgi:hypothetical protein
MIRSPWLFGPWLTPDLYPEVLLVEVLGRGLQEAPSVRCESSPPGTRLRVRVEENTASARQQLLELLTEATRRTIEQELASR